MSEIQEVFRKGCLVDLDVGVWSAERKLQPEDLGLTGAEVSENFSLGHKRLIPHEATARLRKLESSARNTLRRFSFSFPFGQAQFVPWVRMEECKAMLDSIIATFNMAADSIVSEFDKHRLAVRSEFTKAAHEAYQRRVALCGGLDCTESEYVNEFLARVDKAYPKAEDLRSKYHMEYTVFQVSLPDITRATLEDIVDGAAKVSLMREAFEVGVRQKVNQFAEGVVLQMRGDAQDVLSRAVRTLKFGKRPTKYTIDMVRKMIDRYSTMDLVGDDGLKARFADFKARVLDMYKDADIIKDAELSKKVVTEMEALLMMTTDRQAIKSLVDKYRRELAGI